MHNAGDEGGRLNWSRMVLERAGSITVTSLLETGPVTAHTEHWGWGRGVKCLQQWLTWCNMVITWRWWLNAILYKPRTCSVIQGSQSEKNWRLGNFKIGVSSWTTTPNFILVILGSKILNQQEMALYECNVYYIIFTSLYSHNYKWLEQSWKWRRGNPVHVNQL